jgi:alpha-D-xyloside xylohydrolase
MKAKLITVILFIQFVASITSAQTYQKTDVGIKTVIKNVEIEIQFYSTSVVRVVKYPQGKAFIKKSLSVINTPKKTVFNTLQNGDILTLKSDNKNLYSFTVVHNR